MKRTSLFRFIMIMMVAMNILNFFLLNVTRTDGDIMECHTFFEWACYNKYSLIAAIEKTPFSEPVNMPILFVLLIPNIIILVCLLLTLKSKNVKESKAIKPVVPAAIAGLIFHLLAFFFMVPNEEVRFATMIKRGMLGNVLYISFFIAIIVLTIIIRETKESDKKSRLGAYEVASLFFIAELLLCFFYVSVLSHGKQILPVDEAMGIKEGWMIKNRYFLTPFNMIWNKENRYHLHGLTESYPYMSYIAITYLGCILTTLLKNKIGHLISIALLLIGVIVSAMGVLDMMDSYYVVFALNNKNGTWYMGVRQVVGLGYYAFLFLNLSFIGMKVMQLMYVEEEK